MFWREFKTKKAAQDTIRGIVNSKPLIIPFESSLISDLILERHYFCSLRGLRPTRFRKLPGSPYLFEGDFSGLPTQAPISWHPVSWKKCLGTLSTEWDWIVRAMRDRIQAIKTRYRELHPICEACNLRQAVETHHANPTFILLSNSVRSSVSDSDICDCLSGWNWFLRDNFTLPEGHKITVNFDQLHADAKLQALCRECHNKTKSRKLGYSDS